MAPLPGRLQTSFMPWRDKSVRCEPGSCSTRKVCPVLNNATEPSSAGDTFSGFVRRFWTSNVRFRGDEAIAILEPIREVYFKYEMVKSFFAA